jgi:methionyl-tRNA synthetase
MKHFYITTPIYYVNDAPHLGHAYTTIVADALARFHRMRGVDTRLLTGTDEHGQKIEQAAAEKGLTPIALADQVVERFRTTWQKLDIQLDDFIRTTEERHKRVVSELWRRIAAKGDIYLAHYEGWYCVSCEAYYTESQLGEGHACPTHKKPVTWVAKEPSYFFRMSNYQDALLAHIEHHPHFIQPENFKNEVVAFVKSGLRDLSVSRTTFQWGIPVPDDPAHVIYVWMDALTNYMSALGDIGSPGYERYWPATCHLIGKDILRFHAVYWPCFLLSAGLPLPRTIFTHGWWSVRGEKIAKSMPATRVDPNQLADDLGVDAVRYFLLREVPLGLDGDFTYEGLIGRYNSDLANDLGNLLNRTLTMAAKFCDGRVPAASAALAASGHHGALATTAAETARDAAMHFESYAPSKALDAIWRLVRETNRYVDTCQPWVLARDPARRLELDHCVHTFLEASSWAARMVAPVMPEKARAILGQLGYDDDAAAAALSAWPDAERFLTDLPTGQRLGQPTPLFPRIDEARANALMDRWIPASVREAAAAAATATATTAATPATTAATATAATATATPAAAPKPADGATIQYDDFARLDLRVARIAAAEAVPKAKKLLKLTLELGGGETRQVVAGIAEAYTAEQVIGRKVIFLANLAPATIRGVRSEGMILAAGDDAILGLSTVDADVPPGTKVR